MSIIGSMYTASTALDAFGDSMAVVGHNIANLNTAGFKASRVEFADIFPTYLGEVETGHGVRLSSATRLFQQGALEPTSNATDLAIAGSGFFVVRDSSGGTFYSRSGQFQLDGAYNLVNQEGYFLQGLSGNISLANAQVQPAQATTTLGLTFNLDAAASVPAIPFPSTTDASDSAWLGASNFSLGSTIYDSQGTAHDLTFLFRKTAPNAWDYRVVAPRRELDVAAANSTELRQLGAGGSLVFDSNGSFNPALSTTSDITSMTWVSGATSQTISAGNLNFSAATQYANASTGTGIAQNGWPQGTFKGIDIDAQGNVRSLYSNGNAQLLATVQMAQFANPDGLDPFGDKLFVATARSGPAQIGVAGSGGRGSIASGSLELSTVDLAAEFVAMIASQRAFQMNSRVITTAGEMYSVAAELKA